MPWLQLKYKINETLTRFEFEWKYQTENFLNSI